MREYIANYLQQYFDEITPMEFYRGIFPAGDLEKKGEQIQGKYNAIAVELLPVEDPKRKNNVLRHVITDDLELLDHLQQSENFIIISPISYAGRSRKAENARFIYALAIDLDGITKPNHLVDLFHQIEIEYLPKPTYIVFSGTGIHLYYTLDQPLPCFKNITKQLADLKKALTKKIWNTYTTSLHDKPQIESLFQGFRMAGGITKDGNRTRVFEVGNKVTIEYLNQFVAPQHQIKDFKYKSKLTLKEAAAKYPEWYEKRVIQKQPRGTWTCKRDLFDWWYKRIYLEAAEGHRYYAVMVLAIMAKKSGISREELEETAFQIVEHLDMLTTTDDNHFTRSDVLAALEMYNDNYITFPIDSIVNLTDIQIQKNKRNGRKQQLHLKLARSNKAILKEAGEMQKEGRPSKEKIVIEWKKQNPSGTKAACIKETGLSKPTVYKYWDCSS
jgi:hypothetical protein